MSTMSFDPFGSPTSSTHSNSEEKFAFYTNDDDYDDDDEDLLTDDVGDCTSFREMGFESEEMKHLLKLESPPNREKVVRPDYHAEHLFPQWILNNHEWQSTECRGKGNKISEILQTSHALRSQEQTSSLIHWLMSVWTTAYTMGYKRCGQMSKVFQFLVYAPGQDIIVEGEKGLTFYIIISGDAIVLKAGIGQVAVLHKGHSFGELALTEGNDRRSATIRADTKVEILQLHKVDYDHFVKDIQLVERRENLHVLRSCKLFENWPRTKVQKMCNFCSRMTFKPEENIYCQGDKPDKIYFIIEGQVDIFKEVYVVVRNRWPTGMKTWEGMGKKRVKPFLSKSLFKDDFFGELVQDKRRTATATAKTRCTLLTLDRLEFTHLTSGGRILEELQSGEMETNGDRKILDTMLRQLSIKGGPSTTAQLNDYVKVINIKATKKKRQPSISAAGSVSSTVRNHLNTDQSIESNPTDCDAETDTINSDQSSFVSPVKVKKPRRVSGNSSGRKRTDSAASGTSETNESAAQGSLAEGSSDEEMDHFDSSESFAHGLNIDRNKATEFSLASSSTESARLLKHRHRMSAKLFEQHLSRASSACEDTSSGRAGKVSKKNSFNELMDSVSQSMHNNAGDNLQERQHQLQGKVAELREKNEVDVDSHLKLMVTEIVSAKKKIKYYDELAEMRFSAPEIVTNRTRKVNVINGHSLKFSGSTMKNYFMEPTKTVYCPSKNLKKSKKNPIVKITDERSPVMTSIKSVVMKSDKGRMVHSKLSQDINCYTDATKKKSPVRPATLAPLSADKSRLKLSHELSSYSEKEVFPPLRIPTPTKDFARQVSRNNMEGEQQKEVA